MPPSAAAIYARISSDPDGTSLGVQRQVADCRALAERRGWPVAEVYVDNDVSAYKRRVRPEYKRMLADIADHQVDAIVVWHLDRLHRQPAELEAFFEVVDAAGVRDLASVTGDTDLGTDDGRFLARILGAVARKESDDKSRRLRRKHLELAEAGKLTGGSRPFGFEADRLTIRPDEAAIVVEMADRYLSGDSLSSMAHDLNGRGIMTSAGNEWRPNTLRRMLVSARICGQRSHRGEIVATAVWPAIISPEIGARVRAVATRTAARHAPRPPRRYLLAGMCRCGLCGAKLHSRPMQDGTRRYVCSPNAGDGGCGKIAVMADPLERLICEAVLYRLDTPELAQAMNDADSNADNDTTQARTQLVADTARLDDLSKAYGAGEVTMREWQTARTPIADRIAANERRLTADTTTGPAARFLGQADQLATAWADLTLSRQQAVVKALIDYVTINPSARKGAGFDTDRAVPAWRL